MPISLPPISRRRFIHGAAALAGSAAVPRSLWAMQGDERPDPHRIALLSDTHIDRNPATVNHHGNVNMTDYLNRCITQLLAGRPPAHALFCGDVAYLVGRKEDYDQFLSLAVRLLERGVPVHCVLGNHDHYENFFEAGIARQPETPPVAGKHVGVVRAERANWLLLDSLVETDTVYGQLGESQQDWLAQTLDGLDDKPVMVMVHHNFDWIQRDGSDWGLRDAGPMFETLSQRQNVKAVFYGHSHDWKCSQRDDGLYLVNLPPTAYVFAPGKPNGWVDCRLAEDAATLTLNCIDRRHGQHGEQVELDYR
ncbi:MAG: metallophosphoesterase family protein [Phycisphaerales bacterium JB063]